jgi:outer membrane protein assembly factor BamB
MSRFILFLSITLIISCKPKDNTATDTATAVDTTAQVVASRPPGLKLAWESEKTLTTSESVLYDKTNNLLYVSCINGVPPDKKDKDGFIARMGLDGKIITLKWATGLSAPKGMGISGNLLYVTDITRLVAIDMATGKISKEWEVKGASFLNDVAIGDDGTVYFTDSGTKMLHALTDGSVTTVQPDKPIEGLNGVYVDGHHLMLSGYESGNVYRLDLSTKQLQTVADSIPAGDGIERYGDGWLVSNWNGEVHHVSATGAVWEILDSQEAKLNTADIEVIEEKNLLLIPTFFGNGVTAYEMMHGAWSKNNLRQLTPNIGRCFVGNN